MIWSAAALAVLALVFVIAYGSVVGARLESGLTSGELEADGRKLDEARS